MLVEATKY